MTRKWDIWIDTGGTFTDCIARDPLGQVTSIKILSSSRLRCRIDRIIDPLNFTLLHTWPLTKDILGLYTIKTLTGDEKIGIEQFDPQTSQLTIKTPFSKPLLELADLEICSPEEVPILASRILTQTRLDQELPPINLRLGSTKGTNALLERKGARVAFVTTKGFKDLLIIGNQQRKDLFSLVVEKPKPYYHLNYEINERINSSGEPVVDLDLSELNELIRDLKKNKIESVALAFLHSYLNPVHEKLVEKVLKGDDISYVSTSADLSNSIKILPRAETTVANAYLDPIIKSYIHNIRRTIKSSFKVMTSAGGLNDGIEVSVGHGSFRPGQDLDTI